VEMPSDPRGGTGTRGRRTRVWKRLAAGLAVLLAVGLLGSAALAAEGEGESAAPDARASREPASQAADALSEALPYLEQAVADAEVGNYDAARASLEDYFGAVDEACSLLSEREGRRCPRADVDGEHPGPALPPRPQRDGRMGRGWGRRAVRGWPNHPIAPGLMAVELKRHAEMWRSLHDAWPEEELDELRGFVREQIEGCERPQAVMRVLRGVPGLRRGARPVCDPEQALEGAHKRMEQANERVSRLNERLGEVRDKIDSTDDPGELQALRFRAALIENSLEMARLVVDRCHLVIDMLEQRIAASEAD